MKRQQRSSRTKSSREELPVIVFHWGRQQLGNNNRGNNNQGNSKRANDIWDYYRSNESLRNIVSRTIHTQDLSMEGLLWQPHHSTKPL